MLINHLRDAPLGRGDTAEVACLRETSALSGGLDGDDIGAACSPGLDRVGGRAGVGDDRVDVI